MLKKVNSDYKNDVRFHLEKMTEAERNDPAKVQRVLSGVIRAHNEKGESEIKITSKSNIISTLKMAIADPETKAVGVFYMVRRLAGSLPDYLPDFVPKGLKEQISSIMTDNSEPANRVKFYDDWCDKYDEDLVIVGNYTGHIK